MKMMKNFRNLALATLPVFALAMPASAEEQVTMTWLHHYQEEALQLWAEECVEQFEEKHPNVTINIEMVANDSYLNTLKMKTAAGDAPMIFDLDNNTYLQDFVNAGHVYCLDGQEFCNLVDADLQREAQVDGKNYGVVMSTSAYNTYYNKAIFEENGLEVPTTFEEFTALCDKLLELGITPMATGFGTQAAGFNMWVHPWYTNYCWKEDFNFCQDKASGESNFSDDQRVKDAYLEFMSTSKYWGEDPFGTTYDDACMQIANGTAAMINNGSWVISKLLDYNPDLEIGVFGFPTEKYGNQMIMRPGSVNCVYNSDDEEKVKYALEFLSDLCSVEGANHYAQRAIQMSTIDGVDYSFNSVLGDIINYEDKWSYSGFKKWGNEYDDLWNETVMAYALEGNLDADAFCAELDDKFSTLH